MAARKPKRPARTARQIKSKTAKTKAKSVPIVFHAPDTKFKLVPTRTPESPLARSHATLIASMITPEAATEQAPPVPRVPWTPLPRLQLDAVIAVEKFLVQRYGSKRPPEVAAKVLSLVIELWRLSKPFPTRDQIAAEFACTKWGVDAVISTALARDLIYTEIGTEDRHHHRPSVVRMRYFIPSDELVAASGLVNRAA